MNKLAEWGNQLYTGKRSYPFTQKHRLWFLIAGILMIAAILVPVAKGGFNLGIDFRGGSEFMVSGVQNTQVSVGEDVVKNAADGAEATVTNIAPGTMRVQTDRLSDDQTISVAGELAQAYEVEASEVTSNFIGPTWGQDVSRQALLGLLVFIVLVGLLMAAYFRTWKMSAAAIIGLLVVIIITAGIYSLSGFEITPSAIIGFLTILSYCLYDTVVVFDKFRENTRTLFNRPTRTKFSEQVNLGDQPDDSAFDQHLGGLSAASRFDSVHRCASCWVPVRLSRHLAVVVRRYDPFSALSTLRSSAAVLPAASRR